MTRRLNLLLLVLIAIVGIPFYWTFLDSGLGSARPRPIAMDQLRTLAGAIPGEPPREVRHELIGSSNTLRDTVAAGTGIRSTRVVHRAFQIVLNDAPAIIVGSGLTPGQADKRGFDTYDRMAQQRFERASAEASIRIPLALSQKTVTDPLPRGAQGDGPRPVAPGVVVIPMPDVAPGQAMVYVRLADGAEWLMIGDIAPSRDNWSALVPPSRYYSDTLHRFDRSAQIGWLMTINALHREAPHMTIAETRDPRVIPQAPRGFAP